jgi:ketosteroid isomerase-like protein
MITAGSAAGQSASGKPEVVVEAFYDALSSGDCSRAKQLLSPDFAAVFTGEGFYKRGRPCIRVVEQDNEEAVVLVRLKRPSCRGPINST